MATRVDRATRKERAQRARKNSYAELARTGPGSIAGRYMRSFWQPIYLARDLKLGHAMPVRIMGQSYTLYRGESGSPYVIDPRCAHRGTQLSIGKVRGECLECVYHGWQYDGSGQCVNAPYETANFAKTVRIGGYPAREYLGLIFAYLGEGKPPDFPLYPEFDTGTAFYAESHLRRCNYFYDQDNTPDPVHVYFVHNYEMVAGFDFAAVKKDLDHLPDLSGLEDGWGLLKLKTADEDRVHAAQGMPNIIYVKISLPIGGKMTWIDLMAWRIPIEDETHVSFAVVSTPVASEEERARVYEDIRKARDPIETEMPPRDEVVEKILRGELTMADVAKRRDFFFIQDDVAQVGQGPLEFREAERLGRSDALVSMLRKMWWRELRALEAGKPLKQWKWQGIDYIMAGGKNEVRRTNKKS